MKKGVYSLLICLLLSGCTIYNDASPEGLLTEVSQLATQNPRIHTTMNKDLYSYYLPKDVGRIKSNELSSLFVKNGTKFIMNFNPNHIVIHDYYEKELAKEFKPVEIVENDQQHIVIEGSYHAYNVGVHPLRLQIEKTKGKEILMYFDFGFVNFSSVTYPSEVQGLVHSMFIIAQSFDFSKPVIIANYSLKSSTEQAIDLDEYDEELPDSGQLSDLIEKKGEQ